MDWHQLGVTEGLGAISASKTHLQRFRNERREHRIQQATVASNRYTRTVSESISEYTSSSGRSSTTAPVGTIERDPPPYSSMLQSIQDQEAQLGIDSLQPINLDETQDEDID